MTINEGFFGAELFEPEIQFDQRELVEPRTVRPRGRVSWMSARGTRSVFAALTLASVLTLAMSGPTTDNGPFAVFSPSVARDATNLGAALSLMHTVPERPSAKSGLRLITMSERDQLAFAKAILDKDAQPNDKLRAAAERHGYAEKRS